jgi:hypothetical protein
MTIWDFLDKNGEGVAGVLLALTLGPLFLVGLYKLIRNGNIDL